LRNAIDILSAPTESSARANGSGKMQAVCVERSVSVFVKVKSPVLSCVHENETVTLCTWVLIRWLIGPVVTALHASTKLLNLERG